MIKFDYIKCPLNRYTFKVKNIKKWVEQECEGLTLNLFAGKTKLDINEIRNDLDKDSLAEYYLDALEFCKFWNKEKKFDTILLDPPYALRKSMEMYGGRKVSKFNKIKDCIVDMIKDNGKIITFGYHSVSMGKKRGFNIEKIALFSHGGAIHDTIATIERKNEKNN